MKPAMILLRGKNIQLRTVDVADIELMRCWRNSDEIKKYHVYRGDISVEEQQQWFEKIDASPTDFFFLIENDMKKFGLTKLQNIDWEKKEGQAGIYIAAPEDRNSFVSVEAALLVIDFFFKDLELKRLMATVLEQNTVSTAFVERLGFTLSHQDLLLIDNTLEMVNSYMMCQDDYDTATERIRKKFLTPGMNAKPQ